MPLPRAAHSKSEVQNQCFEGERGAPGVSSCKGQYSACLRLLACARSSSVIPWIQNLPPTSQTQVPAWHFMLMQQFRHQQLSTWLQTYTQTQPCSAHSLSPKPTFRRTDLFWFCAIRVGINGTACKTTWFAALLLPKQVLLPVSFPWTHKSFPFQGKARGCFDQHQDSDTSGFKELDSTNPQVLHLPATAPHSIKCSCLLFSINPAATWKKAGEMPCEPQDIQQSAPLLLVLHRSLQEKGQSISSPNPL